MNQITDNTDAASLRSAKIVATKDEFRALLDKFERRMNSRFRRASASNTRELVTHMLMVHRNLRNLQQVNESADRQGELCLNEYLILMQLRPRQRRNNTLPLKVTRDYFMRFVELW